MFLRSARHMAIPGISTNDREHFVVRADEKLTAFLELERAALIGAASFATDSLAHAEDPGGKHHKHHKVQEWLSLLSEADRAKLRAAKQQALKDAAVQAANQRRNRQRLSISNYSTKKCSKSIRPSNRYSTQSPS